MRKILFLILFLALANSCVTKQEPKFCQRTGLSIKIGVIV